MLVSVIRSGFGSATERRSFEARMIFRHQTLVPAGLNVDLMLFDLNFSKSARACNVTSMFWISLERYIVSAFSVVFKPFRKREHPCPSRLPLRAHFHRERDVRVRGSPWNVWFFLSFLHIFCKNFETFDIYELRQTRTAFMVKCVIGHFTVMDGSDAEGDLALIQTFLLYHVNQFILMLSSVFQEQFP